MAEFTCKKSGILINSIPKSGTHYLRNIFDELLFKRYPAALNAHAGEYWMFDYKDFIDHNGNLITNDDIVFADSLGATRASLKNANIYLVKLFKNLKKNQFLMAHSLYHPRIATHIKKFNTNHIILFRNPADVATAMVNASHDIFTNETSLDKKYRNYVLGCGPYSFKNLSLGVIPIELVYKNMEKWLINTNAYPLFFEDIIGDKGGGSTEKATKSIQIFLKMKNYEFKDENVSQAINNAFGNSPTFRLGKVSSDIKQIETDDLEVIEALNRCTAYYEYLQTKYKPKNLDETISTLTQQTDNTFPYSQLLIKKFIRLFSRS